MMLTVFYCVAAYFVILVALTVIHCRIDTPLTAKLFNNFLCGSVLSVYLALFLFVLWLGATVVMWATSIIKPLFA